MEEDIVKLQKKYDAIVIDVVNFAYRVFEFRDETPVDLNPGDNTKKIYIESICKFINSVEELKNKYLDSYGEIYLLWDNYFSRQDLQSVFTYAEDRKKIDEAYKATRKKEKKPFYTSLNFLRYYYLIGPSMYHTIRIDGLEADDLVKPLLDYRLKDKKVLFVTTDYDWCRYLYDNVEWLPKLNEEPQGRHEVSLKMGFPLTESNLICYKSMFGDKSDNITGLVTNNENNFNDFLSLLPIDDPLDIIKLSRNDKMRKEHPILNAIGTGSFKNGEKLSYERQYLINVYLVSSIPCSIETLESYITNGREASTLLKTVRESIGIDGAKNKFVFGNVRRPRTL